MSNTRIDPSQSSVQVTSIKHEGPKAREGASPFRAVMAGSVNALLTGAEVATGVIGGSVLAAAVREARTDVVSGIAGGGGGAAGGGAAATAAGASASPDGGIASMHAMQRENQVFNLQLLALQQKVQTENQSTATVSALQKSSHDAKMETIRKL
jgi:hypothetical protein